MRTQRKLHSGSADYPDARGGLRRHAGVAGACLLVALSAAALADVAIVASIRDYSTGRPVDSRARILVKGGGVRIDLAAFAGDKADVVCPPGQDVFWYLDHANRRYVEFDPESLASMGRTLKSAMGLGKGVSAPMVVAATKETARVGEFPCQRFVVTQNGQKRQDIWVTSWSRSGIEKTQMQGFKRFAGLFEVIRLEMDGTPVFDGVGGLTMAGVLRVDGFPTLIRHLEDGRLVYEVRLSKPQICTLEAGHFSLPEGYRKESLASVARSR
jgi:hypothetical protein